MRVACGHAACNLLGVFSLVLVDKVSRIHGADVYQRLLDFVLCTQRIEAVVLLHAEESFLFAPCAGNVVVSPSPMMRKFGGRTSM